MTKDDIIKRLNVLSNALGRTVSVSGTKEELKMRLRELEEERAEINDENDDVPVSSDNDSRVTTLPDTESTENASETQTDSTASTTDRVTVTALKTLHVDGWHAHRDEKVEFVSAKTVFRVSAASAVELRRTGLVQ